MQQADAVERPTSWHLCDPPACAHVLSMQATLTQGVLKHLSRLQMDSEPSIRANTTVLLGNIAKVGALGTCIYSRGSGAWVLVSSHRIGRFVRAGWCFRDLWECLGAVCAVVFVSIGCCGRCVGARWWSLDQQMVNTWSTCSLCYLLRSSPHGMPAHRGHPSPHTLSIRPLFPRAPHLRPLRYRSQFLGEACCKKVLLNAFARALKDPFPPARTAALRAMLATQQYYAPEEMACRAMPSLVPLTVDTLGGMWAGG